MARSGVGQGRTPQCNRFNFGYSGQSWYWPLVFPLLLGFGSSGHNPPCALNQSSGQSPKRQNSSDELDSVEGIIQKRYGLAKDIVRKGVDCLVEESAVVFTCSSPELSDEIHFSLLFVCERLLVSTIPAASQNRRNPPRLILG
jgi:hypothetical protein